MNNHPASEMSRRAHRQLAGLLMTSAALWAAPVHGVDGPVQVFVLAGQSNMEGQAAVNWTARDDVWVHYQREDRPLLAGALGVGFSIYGGRHHFSPELQFGHVLGNALGKGMLGLLETAPPVRFDPVTRQIEGWTVHIDPAMLAGEYTDEGAAALTMLENHLQRIKILVLQPQLSDLQKVGIWIEHDHPRLKSMQYHPSRGWLVSNRHDPRLTKMVHITQARELLSRQQMLKHPAVVLHELAHAYHDQFLDFDYPEIIAVFEQAQAAGIYEKVLLYTGEQVKHYALSNHKEYFAEGTEAYFYRNDFYPFVRAELKEFDPKLHDLLEKIWGAAR